MISARELADFIMDCTEGCFGKDYIDLGTKYPLFAMFYTKQGYKDDDWDYYDYVKVVYKETDGKYYDLWVKNYPYSTKNALYVEVYNWSEQDYVNESRKFLRETEYVVEMIDNREMTW